MSARVTAGRLALGLLLLGGLPNGAGAQTITHVAVAGANLRERPSPDAAVVATVDKGTELEVLGREGEWLMVRVVATKVEGWVKPEFLESRAPAPTAVTPLATTPAPFVRKAPGPPHRLRIDLGGAFALAPAGFSESRRITQFAEEGRIDTAYSGKGGPGFDAGLLYRVTRHIGAAVAFSAVSTDESGTFTASLPHPLYYGQPRQARGQLTGSRKETAAHADLVFTASSDRLDLHLFGGPTWTSLRAGLLSDVQYSQAYPFDTVTVTGAPVVEESASRVGFNVGAGVDYRPAQRFGLGAQVRWSRAKVTLAPAAGASVEVDAGGLRIGVGARLFF